MNYGLKFAIIRSGFHQCELTNDAGISEVRLSKIINGRIEPSQLEKRKIARALNIESIEIFDTNVDNVKPI